MNKVILIGNLTRAPELRTTTSGVSVCNFTVAINRRFANAQGVKEADFISIVVWRQLAELCAKYLDKGRKCGIVGQLQTRTYEAPDGTKRYVTEVVADDVEFLDRAPAQSGDGPFVPNSYQQHQPQDSSPSFQGEGFAQVDDDELPF